MEETATTSKIVDVLEILSDGKWHRMKEVQNGTEMDEKQVQQIAEFLGKYDFIALDETRKKIKLNKVAQKFLAQPVTA
jgi:hypothetical protein